MTSLYSYDKPMNSNIYSCNYTDDIREAREKYYADQKRKVINPNNSTTRAPYARSVLTYNAETIGPVPSDLKYEEQNVD